MTLAFESMPIAPHGEGFLGHNKAFREHRMEMLDRLSLERAPLLRLKLPLPGVRAAVVNHPDVVQEMLVEKGKSFDKSGMVRFAIYPLAGEGLFSANGELWKKQRKLMAPLFHPRALETYAADMVACAERAISSWRDGESLTLLHETTRLTMGIAGKTLFDTDTFAEADEIGRALTVALEWSGSIIGKPFAIAHVVARRLVERAAEEAPWASGPLERARSRLHGPVALFGTRGRELAHAVATLDARVERMIADRKSAAVRSDDLMKRLLDARDETGARMSDKQVRDEVLTLFVAGHETTATGLAWTIYLATRAPDVYAAMEREVDALRGAPTPDDLPKLGLCLRAFREALRLYPPVYVFSRDANEATTLADYEIEKRANLVVSPWALHRNASLWPDPLRFDPDRFIVEREATRHRYSYVPFGAGPRVCIGNAFAYMEAQLALAVMLRAFRFERAEDDEPHATATLRPKHGVRVRVRKRN
jgi:cytochrome P450